MINDCKSFDKIQIAKLASNLIPYIIAAIIVNRIAKDEKLTLGEL